MQTKLERIAEIAKERPEERFTSLIHLINEESLIQAHRKMKAKKVPGIDKVTKDKYKENLKENVKDLITRMKRNAYRPQPVLRRYIFKIGTNKTRPLGLPAYEDKLVQLVLKEILEAVYEQDFLNCSYGFRPYLGCHKALKALNYIIEKKRINYIVDVDIKGFFEHLDHKRLMEFLSIRIADPKINRLIVKFLKAGVMEEGRLLPTSEGTPQGGIISPLLANIYLHYVLDLWFKETIRERCKGSAYLIRYADDAICCFQYPEEAHRFYQDLIERLKEFNLELAEDKSKIIPFGIDSLDRVKPLTFDFLGFTHYAGKSKKGKFRVKRKTARKKYTASLKRCKEWLKINRNTETKIIMQKLTIKLLGYYRYYGITDNTKALVSFRTEVGKLLFKWMNRRSQKRSFDWNRFNLFLKRYPLPIPKITVHIYGLSPNLSYLC
ncbi:group II intron reverse transcriptase/maturase [Candidatus Bipolaricaulota bacterium]|nr:group II intron reverse transcriptase/maturase [Candidatus Bipolaricaulota bacterium]